MFAYFLCSIYSAAYLPLHTPFEKQLQEVFDSPSDREAKMSEFEQRIQNVNESEEEFMTSLLQTFRAANPSAKDDEIDRAVKRKFLQGIPPTLRRNLIIFCQNPYDDKVTPQDLLKARCHCSPLHSDLHN